MSAGWIAMRAGTAARAYFAMRHHATLEMRRPGVRLAKFRTTLVRFLFDVGS